MSADVFLKIEGIQGESVDKVHADEIDVLAWSWGMTQSGTMHIAAGGGSGKVAVQDMVVTKYVDRSSPNLMQKCCTGEHYPQAILTVRKAGSDPLEYLIITMKEVLVTSISSGGSGGEDKLTETISMNFAEFESVYTPQQADGSGGAAVDVAFHIGQNTIV